MVLLAGAVILSLDGVRMMDCSLCLLSPGRLPNGKKIANQEKKRFTAEKHRAFCIWQGD